MPSLTMHPASSDASASTRPSWRRRRLGERSRRPIFELAARRGRSRESLSRRGSPIAPRLPRHTRSPPPLGRRSDGNSRISMDLRMAEKSVPRSRAPHVPRAPKSARFAGAAGRLQRAQVHITDDRSGVDFDRVRAVSYLMRRGGANVDGGMLRPKPRKAEMNRRPRADGCKARGSGVTARGAWAARGRSVATLKGRLRYAVERPGIAARSGSDRAAGC